MATVKECIQEFCYRQNIPAPATFVNVGSQTERYYVSLFQLVGDWLLSMPYDWPQLKKTYIFSTQTNVRKYQLPGDFYKILSGTTRDNTNRWALGDGNSDASFALGQYGIVSSTNQKSYRLIGGQGYTTYEVAGVAPLSAGRFEIDPAGKNNTDQLMLQYIGKNWVSPQSWQPAISYTIGVLVTGIDNIYKSTTAGTSGAVVPSWETGTQTDGGVNWLLTKEAYQISSDNDLVMFDKNIMVEGVRAVYNAGKGADYAQILTAWGSQVISSFTRYNGPVTVNAGDEDFGGDFWPNLPRVA